MRWPSIQVWGTVGIHFDSRQTCIHSWPINDKKDKRPPIASKYSSTLLGMVPQTGVSEENSFVFQKEGRPCGGSDGGLRMAGCREDLSSQGPLSPLSLPWAGVYMHTQPRKETSAGSWGGHRYLRPNQRRLRL